MLIQPVIRARTTGQSIDTIGGGVVDLHPALTGMVDHALLEP